MAALTDEQRKAIWAEFYVENLWIEVNGTEVAGTRGYCGAT